MLNGRPSQFDMQGAWGGALLRCYDTDEEYPDFYWVASKGPTIVNDETEAPAIKQKGWHTVNEKSGGDRLQFRWKRVRPSQRDFLRIKYRPFPNELDPSAVETS